LQAYPNVDAQHLRSLIRQARKSITPDATETSAEGAPRKAKVYREIFQLLKTL
jgi:ribosomal 50S subunit-associated protein YjgA (DUF615 family)